MSSKKISSIVLSAGFSSRMGEFKPLLRIGDKTILERVINTFISADVKDIIVVIGYQSDVLINLLNNLRISWIENPDYKQGMFSSIKAGLRSLGDGSDCDAFFIHPVDIPLIRPHTIKKIIQTYDKKEKNIIYPVFQNRRGHPPLISGGLSCEILGYNGEGGLREFLKKYNNLAIETPVADEGILLDCDTPEDYEYLLKRFIDMDFPSVPECMELLNNIYSVVKHIIGHSQQVASLAVFLGRNLGMPERELDLIRSAGLLHDIARKEPSHDKAGGLIMKELGFPVVAKIIQEHMNINLDSDETRVDASQIIYLSDKMINGTSLVNLEERFSQKLNNTDNPEIKSAIRDRFNNAVKIKERIERITGRPLEEIIMEFSDFQKNNNDILTETRRD